MLSFTLGAAENEVSSRGLHIETGSYNFASLVRPIFIADGSYRSRYLHVLNVFP